MKAKTRLYLTGVITSLFLCSTLGISAQTIQTPEFPNKMMFVNPDGSLTPLDKTMMSVGNNSHSMLGAVNMARAVSGNSKVYYSAEGKSSSVTHSGKKTDTYVLKIGAGIDPENYVELFQFDEVKKNERRFTTAKIDMGRAMTGKDQKQDDNSIEIVYKKLSDGVYLYNTKEDLQPGEYFFLIKGGIGGAASSAERMNGQTKTAFCFKVE